ncbi:MAG: hypothetical protein EBS01_01985 [Verrucomicrobia bacterium]|nr:hypothetical protein [Verrucomicrobiota bacterium]
MDRPAAIRKILSLLCVITLLAMQAFGGLSGYLCRCGGQDAFTQMDHCHGPHSEACHDGERQAAADHLHDQSNDADRENHEPVRQTLQVVQSAGIVVPALFSVLVAILPDWSFLRFDTRDTWFMVSRRAVYFAPAPGILLRQTVALLV